VTVTWEDAIAYVMGELDPEREAQIETRYFAEEESSRRIEIVQQLGEAVAALFTSSGLTVCGTDALARRASEAGLRLRTYVLPEGGGVLCTAAPEDDFVVVRFDVPSAPADERIDLSMRIHLADGGPADARVTEDLIHDPSVGQVVCFYPGALVRSFPKSRWELELRSQGPEGHRVIGTYEMNHTPWEEGGAALG